MTSEVECLADNNLLWRLCFACCLALILFAVWTAGVGRGCDRFVASLGAAYMDHLVAIETRLHGGRGVERQDHPFGWRQCDANVVSGQLHFSSSAGSALSAALRGGPVKIVYTNQSRPTYKLMSNKPEIKTLQDLVGKKIAINTYGDTGHLATLLLMKKYRFDPKSFLFIAVRSEARFRPFSRARWMRRR